MTVQELIDELQLAPDKGVPVQLSGNTETACTECGHSMYATYDHQAVQSVRFHLHGVVLKGAE